MRSQLVEKRLRAAVINRSRGLLDAVLRILRDALAGKLPDSVLDRLRELMEMIRNLPFRVGLAKVQDALYESLRPLWPELSAAAEEGHEPAAQWTGLVRQLGKLLAVRIET